MSIKTLTQLLKNRGLKITTAESCTGGGLAYYLTSLPGSSDWFERGFVTYSNLSKIEMLGVQSSTIDNHGAVSEQTVKEMAEGALKNSAADISFAITGIAGPDGGTLEKPVGTIWLGCSGSSSKTMTTQVFFSGDRKAIREQTIEAAVNSLILFINEH